MSAAYESPPSPPSNTTDGVPPLQLHRKARYRPVLVSRVPTTWPASFMPVAQERLIVSPLKAGEVTRSAWMSRAV